MENVLLPTCLQFKIISWKCSWIIERLLMNDDVVNRQSFSALLAICAGSSPVTGEIPRTLISAWINVWVNNREAGDLRRHCAHYDTVMDLHNLLNILKVNVMHEVTVFCNTCMYRHPQFVVKYQANKALHTEIWHEHVSFIYQSLWTRWHKTWSIIFLLKETLSLISICYAYTRIMNAFPWMNCLAPMVLVQIVVRWRLHGKPKQLPRMIFFIGTLTLDLFIFQMKDKYDKEL